MSTGMKERHIAAALSRLERLEKQGAFDPSVPDSKPTKAQQEFFSDLGRYKQRVIKAGNRSGKSACPAREIAWILNEDHPAWKRPYSWGGAPILIIIAGQDRKMMEIELWGKKIAPFLQMSDWREVRVAGSIQYAENRRNGDKIVFLTHADSSEKNRKHMQGYTAHYVWIDEMPASAALYDEIRLRASAPDAAFVATFTPKFRSEEIRRAVDALKHPYGKIYSFSRLDNPLYKGREHEVMAELDGYSEGYKRSVLYGDWFIGDSAVYEWDPAIMMESPGDDYHPGWRHVVSVDPALKSKFGFTLWAERPKDGMWFLVKARYIEGIYAPDDMVEEVKKEIAGYNIVRRISDPEASWFIGQASKAQLTFIYPPDKASRKAELIKNAQAAISTNKVKVAPWCLDFINEITSCQWSETTDRIINASSYHLMDCWHYFCDLRPKYDSAQVPQSWEQELRTANDIRKKAESKTKKMTKWGVVRAKPIKSWARRGNYKLWN